MPSKLWVVLVAIPLFLDKLFRHQPGKVFGWQDAVTLLAWGSLIAFLAYRKASESIALRTMRADRAFSDRAPGVVEVAMEIVIVNDGTEVGADRGFMWFDGDLLHFNGTATSFTLAPQDIFPRQPIAGKDPYHELPRDCVRLRMPGRPAFVRLMLLRGHHPRAFGTALGRFVGRGGPSLEVRQWPPLTAYSPPMPQAFTGEVTPATVVARNRP